MNIDKNKKYKSRKHTSKQLKRYTPEQLKKMDEMTKDLVGSLNKNMTKENIKEFYLVDELAEKLRVSNMTIYRYIEAGKIIAHKIGKEYRITEEEYNKFLNNVKTK